MSFFRVPRQESKGKEASIKSNPEVSKDKNGIPATSETHKKIKHLYPDPLDNFRSDDPWSNAYESHNLKI